MTDLRERLKGLVAELYQQAALYRRGQEASDERQALAYTQAARKLAAILAESERCVCHSDSVCNEACVAGRHHDGCEPKP